MRGVAYSVRERELLMRMHQQGKSLSALSRETGVARPVLSRLSAQLVPRYCVPPATWPVDTSGQPIYIQSITMSARKLQIGQLWKKDGTGETYLVTRVYNEALSTIVVLRKSGAESEHQVRVKVERTPAGQNIPGFSPAMEDDIV